MRHVLVSVVHIIEQERAALIQKLHVYKKGFKENVGAHFQIFVYPTNAHILFTHFSPCKETFVVRFHQFNHPLSYLNLLSVSQWRALFSQWKWFTSVSKVEMTCLLNTGMSWWQSRLLVKSHVLRRLKYTVNPPLSHLTIVHKVSWLLQIYLKKLIQQLFCDVIPAMLSSIMTSVYAVS